MATETTKPGDQPSPGIVQRIRNLVHGIERGVHRINIKDTEPGSSDDNENLIHPHKVWVKGKDVIKSFTSSAYERACKGLIEFLDEHEGYFEKPDAVWIWIAVIIVAFVVLNDLAVMRQTTAALLALAFGSAVAAVAVVALAIGIVAAELWLSAELTRAWKQFRHDPEEHGWFPVVKAAVAVGCIAIFIPAAVWLPFNCSVCLTTTAFC